MAQPISHQEFVAALNAAGIARWLSKAAWLDRCVTTLSLAQQNAKASPSESNNLARSLGGCR